MSECILTLQLKIQSKCRFCIYRNWLLYCAPISKSVLSIHIAYHQIEGASKDTPCTLSFILFVKIKKPSCHCIDFEFILEEIQQHISQCKQADCDSSDVFFSLTVTVVDFCVLCFCDSFSLCYLLLVACPFLTFLPCRGNLLHMPVHVISEQNDQR